MIGSRLLTCWNGRIFPAVPLPFIFAEGLSLTQSGIITARINSCTVIPRSSASVVRSLKFSSRRDNMNFAKESPNQRGSFQRGSSYKHSEKKYGIFSSQESKNIGRNTYQSVLASPVSRIERPLRPRLPCETR